MTWVKLDDRFPSHRKIASLTDRAFRLHVSALCWCAEHLTDGRIAARELRLVAHIRGMTATARQLEDVGLWERDGDGWVIHDFHDYNPTAETVRAERERNAARQKRFRSRQGAASGPAEPPAEERRNGGRNGVTNGGSRPVTNSAPYPYPSPSSLPDGREPSPLHPPQGTTTASSSVGVPEFARPLADMLTAVGCVVGWRTTAGDREALLRHLDRIPAALLVDAAVRAWNPARPPQSIRYLIRVWDALPDVPADAPAAPPARPAAGRQTATDDLFDRAMQRARVRMAAEDPAVDEQRALIA
ncbi:hypothetical protein [Streptomyces luteireticuli]|uniref:Helix-turn-helix domain-containing protein n=1 Tax=Streptomyces luteireticuli TaxID=173858 RepID=A0ABP3ITC2_9ACTN